MKKYKYLRLQIIILAQYDPLKNKDKDWYVDLIRSLNIPLKFKIVSGSQLNIINTNILQTLKMSKHNLIKHVPNLNLTLVYS